MAFADHFSSHAAAYAAHRPTYPASLFAWLADQTPGHALAWDVATGNGQAAVALGAQFDSIYASDASAGQIEQAQAHSKVAYHVEPAERCGLADHAADLVVVGQALHWFDHARFFAEVQRVLRPRGVFAAWCYELLNVDDAVDHAVRTFYDGPIGPYWPPERRFIERGYVDIDVPFAPLDAPAFEMALSWTRSQLLAYLGTW